MTNVQTIITDEMANWVTINPLLDIFSRLKTVRFPSARNALRGE